MKRNRIVKKMLKDRTSCMTEERKIKKRSKDKVINMSQERIIKKKSKDIIKNMQAEQIIRKRSKDLINNIKSKNYGRFTKRKENIKKQLPKAFKYKKNITLENDYIDNGNMDISCEFCNALYWTTENVNHVCCLKGKVKVPILNDYPDYLKKLILYDRKFRDAI